MGGSKGVVVVQVAEGLRGEVTRSGGLLQVDAAELPPSLAGAPGAFSYRYAAVPFDLQLALEKVQPRILVDSLVEADLQPDRLTLDVLAIYTIQRAGVFRLEWDVPPGYEVRQVRGRAAAGRRGGPGRCPPSRQGEEPAGGQSRPQGDGPRRARTSGCTKTLREPDLLTPPEKTEKQCNCRWRCRRSCARPSSRRRAGSWSTPRRACRSIDPAKTEGLRTISFAEAVQGMQSTREPAGKPSRSRPVLAFAFDQGPADAGRSPPSAASRR